MTFMRELAEGCMPFLYFLQDIRNGVFDFLFSLVTHLGEETIFLVIAILFFWCINKRQGYYILITGLVGTVVNQMLKLFFRIPRPWDLDPNFEIVEAARAEATGYSFPSGHTQNIAGTFGAIAAFKKGKVRTAVCTTIILLVAFSRMYLGVHTPLDVIVSLVLALGLILLLRPVFVSEANFKKFMPWVVVGSVVLSSAFLAYVLGFSGVSFIDPHNYQSALKNACTLLGCTVGLVLVYVVDSRFINFRTDGKWYAQAIKLVLGLGVVLAIKSGLSSPLTHLFGNELVARSVRYFLIVAFAGAVWPLTFKWFSELKIGFLDRLTDNLIAKFKKKT
jgi:undecaprenyl-diphosphatase